MPTDIARYEANIAEANDEYQRLLARIRQLPRESDQIDGLVDDLNHAQYTRTFYQQRLGSVAQRPSGGDGVTIDHDTEDYRVICHVCQGQTTLRVLFSPNNLDFDMEVLTTDGWHAFNLSQVHAYHLLQLIGPHLTPDTEG